jgi:hypothetical protein
MFGAAIVVGPAHGLKKTPVLSTVALDEPHATTVAHATNNKHPRKPLR